MSFLLRGVVVVAVVLACATGLTAAFGLLVAADYFAFATILSPVFAALAAAGTAVLFCLLAIIIGKIVLGRMSSRPKRSMHARVASVAG
ncbi:MAG TPA: hypothetical protein VGK90_12620, partial [Rhizomicrobium sp.]